MKYFLAIDIGASSGRHIIGYYDNGLKTIEVFRFPNSIEKENGHLVWNLDYLFTQVKLGIKKALEMFSNIESLSIDTWGVDYVLMNHEKEILPCYSYRDNRTKSIIEEVHNLISFEDLYKITGCQFQEFNTIYQLYADKKLGRLDDATTFLHIPEYLIYRLTGKMVKEYTNASTTGMLDGDTNFYSDTIINKLGLKKDLFSKLEKPRYVVGSLLKEIQDEVGGNIKVTLCPTHDTASAVEGINMKENAPYISSGTWSLLGLKVDKIINSSEAREANFSNEYGPNYIRFQKNIMGLWIIQSLAKQMNLSFTEMVELSKKSQYKETFDVNDNLFLSSLDMKKDIINWFLSHNIIPPKEDIDIINSTYRSLAYSYSIALKKLEKITNHTYQELYIVGGGAKNKYLNALTEEFTNKKVIALPIEATAIGNLLSQMEK
ncbi:MAG: rhamnulokinase family protein [Bacilli bacterium]